MFELFLCGDCLGVFRAVGLDVLCPYCGGEDCCSCNACQRQARAFLVGEVGRYGLTEGLVLLEWRADGASIFFDEIIDCF